MDSIETGESESWKDRRRQHDIEALIIYGTSIPFYEGQFK